MARSAEPGRSEVSAFLGEGSASGASAKRGAAMRDTGRGEKEKPDLTVARTGFAEGGSATIRRWRS